jgi:hypothetical protein
VSVTFAPGAPDLEVTVGPETVTGTLAFAPGAPTLTVTSGVPTVALYDEDGGWLANLPTAEGIVWQHELSAPGSLACRLPLEDATAATPKRILKVFWRGRARQAARIDSSGVTVSEDGRRWREFNLPGILATTGDALVYPETGLDHATSGQRSFGYMSKHGSWFSTGNWSAAIGSEYNDPSQPYFPRQPEGLSYPNPSWIAKNGVTTIEANGQIQYFRRGFVTTTENLNYQILATADDFLTLWLDGEQLYSPDSQQPYQWQSLQQITGVLPAGTHLLAAKVENMKWYGHNIMGFIFTMQQLQADGDVVLGSPIVNSNSTWIVADNAPGFRRADVLATVFAEATAREVKAFQVLSVGFTHDRDSRGTAWSDTPGEYGLDTMTTVLDAVQTMTEKALDVDVDFDTLTVNAYNRAGGDKYSTVKLDVGSGRTGSLTDHRVDRVEAKFNTALIQLADGTYAERQDATSLAAYGRIETGLQLGSTADLDTAAEVATAAFTESANTAFTVTSTASTLDGPQLYADWTVGDSIGVPNENGDGYLKVRVMSVTVDASKDGAPVVTPEFAMDRT